MKSAAASPRRTRGLLGGRSQQVLRRVLDAALVEFARSGYADFRMEAVAARAGVNKTTVYRRWPNRLALVSALVEQLRAPLREAPLPDTGQLERDLIEALERRSSVGRNVEGRAWARLLQERHLPEVESLIGSAVEQRRDEWKTMVRRAMERGEVPGDTDAQRLLDVVRAIVDGRAPTRRLDAEWLAVAVKTVIAGARAGTLSRGRTLPAGTKRRRTAARPRGR